MKPEHYLSDLRLTAERLRERLAECREAVPPVDADPVVIARWEGAFGMLRAILTEEVGPLLSSWEEHEPHWRRTEQILANEALAPVLLDMIASDGDQPDGSWSHPYIRSGLRAHDPELADSQLAMLLDGLVADGALQKLQRDDVSCYRLVLEPVCATK